MNNEEKIFFRNTIKGVTQFIKENRDTLMNVDYTKVLMVDFDEKDREQIERFMKKIN